MPSIFIDWRGAGPNAAAMHAKSRRRRWVAALIASGAVHALASAALVTAYLQVPVEPPPIHVTLLESAPPPPAPHAVETSSTAPVEPPKPEVKKEKRKVPKLARKTKHPKRRPTRVPTPSELSSHAAPPTAVATPGSGVAPAGGKAGGIAGGVPKGLVGGIVGGHGNRVYRPEEIASSPIVLKKVVPQYPPIARARGLEGLVVLEAVIDRHGRIENDRIRIVRSVHGLDRAAVGALRQWRFRPGRDKDGRPVRVLVEIPFRFRLR